MITQRWGQVKSIFAAALERPVEERAELVALLCGSDHQLAAEVAALLQADHAMGSFMNEAAAPLPYREDDRSLQAGKILAGRFQIVGLLGEGGMGRVYEALDLDLGESLALKTIRSEIASDPRTIELFIREIQLARKVTHPNVCRIFDLERDKTDSSSVIFLTMELLAGETLEDFLQREGPLQVTRALPLVQQMADALAAIHGCGVIHRDFKPGNVLLVNTNSKLRLVVTDFGLARPQELAMAASANGGTSLRSGFMGTPAYMAPEQLEGNPVSPATDIYALGLVMHRMIAGQLPGTTEATARPRLARSEQVFTSPVKGSIKLDIGWERVIARCLEVNPAQRYQQVTELINDLPGCARLGFPARDISPTKRLARTLAWVIGLLSVLVIFVATVSVLRKRQNAALGTVELTPVTSDTGLTWTPAISASGDTLAYASDRDGPGNLRIWVQKQNDSPKVITHDSSDDNNPALSPDGSLIAYRSSRDGGGIYIASTNDGSERLLARGGRNPQFSPDGKQIVYWVGEEHNLEDVLQVRAQMFLIPSAGGTPVPFHPEFVDARYPVWSPDGEHILFQGAPGWTATYQDGWEWWVASVNKGDLVATGAFQRLIKEEYVPYGCPFTWSKGGIIFSARKAYATSLWQLQLDDNFQSVGAPRRLTAGTEDDIHPWLSPGGKLVLASTRATVNIWSIAPDSNSSSTAMKRITTSESVDSKLSVSANGQFLLFRQRTGLVERMLLRNQQTGVETTLGIPADSASVVDPTGEMITYSTRLGEKRPMFVTKISAQASRQICGDCGDLKDVSQDGRFALYSISTKKLGLLDIGSGQQLDLLSSEGVDLEQPRFSPDGRWVAFVSTADEQHCQIHAVRLDQGSHVYSRSNSAITEDASCDLRPTWSADGNSMFFYSNRDGFYCIWRQTLDPISKRPLGTPKPVQHFHYARVSPMHLSRDSMDLALAGNILFFNLCELTGNIFTADLIGR